MQSNISNKMQSSGGSGKTCPVCQGRKMVLRDGKQEKCQRCGGSGTVSGGYQVK